MLEQLREQQSSLAPVEGRPAQKGDYAVIAFEGRLDGEVVEGAASERFPLVIGNERMVPGFEDAIVGMAEGETRTFTVTFPEDYGQAELAAKDVEFTATLRELRERRLPPVDDAFAQSLGSFADVAALKADLQVRMGRSALDRARHGFADRIIEYATANATVGVSDLLVTREVDVMDPTSSRSGSVSRASSTTSTSRSPSATRPSCGKSPASRPRPASRCCWCWVPSPTPSRSRTPDAAVEAELERGRRSSPDDRRLLEYLESPRGRAYVRSTLRRSQVVEQLIDRWIEKHPQFADVRHTEDQVMAAEPDAIDMRRRGGGRRRGGRARDGAGRDGHRRLGAESRPGASA